eukprot:tig00020704_g13176.t1
MCANPELKEGLSKEDFAEKYKADFSLGACSEDDVEETGIAVLGGGMADSSAANEVSGALESAPPRLFASEAATEGGDLFFCDAAELAAAAEEAWHAQAWIGDEVCLSDAF